MPAKLTTTERARKAARDRWNKPENVQRRVDRLAEHIREVVEKAHPLAPADVEHLRGLLPAAPSEDGGRDAAA